MNTILIAGNPISFQTTVAHYFKNVITRAGKKCIIAHFADLLKWQCKTFYGWDGETTKPGRTLLQETADKVESLYGEDYYARQLIKQAQLFADEIDYLIVDDWSYDEEYEAIRDAFCHDGRWVRTFYVVAFLEDGRLTEQEPYSSERFCPTPHRDIIITHTYKGPLDSCSDIKEKVDSIIEKYHLI